MFVHGMLVDGTLWSGVADALAARGVRSFAPDLPLGCAPHPPRPDAEQSPRGVARQVIALIEALDLDDVTLVGNDTGGAICQYLLDTDASRIGRVVLTNCDAFEQFPPPSLRQFIELVTRPTALAARRPGDARDASATAASGTGRSPLFDADMTAAWVEPARTDERIRDDVARFARAVDPDDLVAVGARLRRSADPSVSVWGAADPYFTLGLARRLAAAFTAATSSRSPAPARSSRSTRPSAWPTRSRRSAGTASRRAGS